MTPLTRKLITAIRSGRVPGSLSAPTTASMIVRSLPTTPTYLSHLPDLPLPWLVEQNAPNSGDVLAQFANQADAELFQEIV